MIPGFNGGLARDIEKFVLIDHCGEGLGVVTPNEDEYFVGIPFGYYGHNTLPFIEVWKDGKLLRSINCSDVSEIWFN